MSVELKHSKLFFFNAVLLFEYKWIDFAHGVSGDYVVKKSFD